MIVALKATGCAKVVNTQTESQMGKSHTHIQHFRIILVRCPHSVWNVTSSFGTPTRFCNIYGAPFCLRRGFRKQINSERFIQTEQNAAPKLSGEEASCWRRHPLANRGNNDKKKTQTRKQTSQIVRLHQQSALLGRVYLSRGT